MLESLNIIIVEILQRMSFFELFFLVLVLMFLNSSIMIPPSEAICVGAGISCAVNDYGLTIVLLVILVATFSNFFGTAIWFKLGRNHRKNNNTGVRAEKWYKALTRRSVESVVIVFEKHTWKPIFSSRLVPVIRSISSYAAGRANIDFHIFSVATLSGIFCWCCLWILAGFLAGNAPPSYVILISLGLAGGVWLVHRYFVPDPAMD